MSTPPHATQLAPEIPLTRRERNRINTAAEIKDLARQQMDAEGAAALSLRAISRAMGMTAPAIYRYFPSRDDLVTALILDAYDSLARAIETADAPLPRADLRGRLIAIAHAYRAWAFAYPAEYSLILGTPIPGYHAPFEITQPAAHRGTVALVEIITEALARTGADPTIGASPNPGGPPSLSTLPGRVRDAAIAAWAVMHGLVSLELYGHTTKLEDATDTLYHQEINAFAGRLGL